MPTPIRALAGALTVALASTILIACSGEDSAQTAAQSTAQSTVTDEAPAPAADGLRVEPVIEDLSNALYVTGRPGDDALYVVQQDGLIRSFRNGRETAPLLDVTDLTAAGGERGLLGLAFHPDHARNGRLYVNYTDRSGTTKVVEYTAPRGGGAVADSAREILSVPQPFANHNGGHLAFGTDGMLFIGLGDGGSGGDPEDNGQRLDTLLGSMLRIDVDARDAGLPYAIPVDNPFVGRDGARDEIWALGLRNPWRYSFDAQTGYLWIGDVGQNQIEEIDRVLGTDGAGTNFGWNRFEGDAAFDPEGRALTEGPATPPVAQYDHGEGCSVTGGYVYRGNAVPALDGRYVYGDFCSGTLWALDADAARPAPPQNITDLAGGPLEGLRSFGTDNEGNLYAIAGDSVRIFRAG